MRSPLSGTLSSAWPTFSCSSSEDSFLSHEWSKHGTCTEGVIADDGTGSAEHAYFAAALNQYSSTDIYNTLSNARITPGGSYSLDSVTSALSVAFGTTYLQCDSNGNLWQVYTCLGADATSQQACPVAPGGDACPSTVNYPTD